MVKCSRGVSKRLSLWESWREAPERASEHRNDERTQRQEHDAEQGGQHDAAGGKLLIVVELDGEH